MRPIRALLEQSGAIGLFNENERLLESLQLSPDYSGHATSAYYDKVIFHIADVLFHFHLLRVFAEIVIKKVMHEVIDGKSIHQYPAHQKKDGEYLALWT